MLRLESVTKRYGEFVALSDVNLEVGKGEFLFLQGPTGCGKTTLLKLCYLEERPTAGVLSVMGERTEKLSRRKIQKLRRKIGVVFEDFRLLPDRNVLDNVSFGLELIGVNCHIARERSHRVLEELSLKGVDNSPVTKLSGGEKQRVAIARALVREPLILLADEPTGRLDNRSAEGIVSLLKDVHLKGTTVVMATHDAHLTGLVPDSWQVRIEKGRVREA